MKLTKGKINKIKGRRVQSKKRIGNKHKHLVKHGRGLSYRKKRHLNFKNQTLKRFGIEVGGDPTGNPGVNTGINTGVNTDDKTTNNSVNDVGKNNAEKKIKLVVQLQSLFLALLVVRKKIQIQPKDRYRVLVNQLQ